ncbi:hypothetical protein KVT40_006263 [Elsinoe batatas]|uniref:MYND-type domain-containing protein n=1 Tax=Elsinoe batatas TaxID=2601811 RepID=A0A8K0PER6_9PEZI|nr:hypothetical protein KVT40_006263 [Elsinoe batatas]
MEHLCAQCATVADKHCTGCHDCPTQDLSSSDSTFYCSVKCQKAHRKIHKTECNAALQRKILVSVADTAYKCIFELRKLMFEMPLVGPVERKDGKLLFNTSNESGTKLRYPTGQSYELPEPLWSSICEKDQQSILAFRACEEAIVLLEPLLQHMLTADDGDIMKPGTTMTALPTVFGNYPFTTHDVLDGVPDYVEEGKVCDEHTVIKLTLKSGQHFILDFTGAQYGIFDHVQPLGKFLDEHVVTVSLPHPISRLRVALETTVDQTGQISSLMKRTRLINNILETYLDFIFKKFPNPIAGVKTSRDAELKAWLDTVATTYHAAAIDVVHLVDPLANISSERRIIGNEGKRLFAEFHNVKPMSLFEMFSASIQTFNRDPDDEDMEKLFAKLTW